MNRIKSQESKSYYDIPDLDHLKRVLTSKRIAVFADLGKFSLIDNRIRFEADKELKDMIWIWGYHNMKVQEDRKTRIFKELAAGKNIILDGFGEIYIGFNPSFERWHDFHGTEFVPPKPFLKFQVSLDFLESLTNF